jgi:hypothetical protein
MFSLTLLDHLRLTFSQIVHRHTTHARAAQSAARWNRRLRGSEALLMGGVSIAAVCAAFSGDRAFAVASAVLAGVALLALLLHLTFDYETSAHAHAACSVRLWCLRERYRALLSDLHDGVLHVEEARKRRDRLMDELRTIYENTPLTKFDDFQISQPPPKAEAEGHLRDEEVDVFLPKGA